jgi:hypothetical protein
MPPFDNRGPIKKKGGLKINNDNSTVPTVQPNQSALFEEQAKKAFSKYEEYKERSLDLSLKFKSMIEDRIRPDVRSPLSKGIEQETLNKLIALASEMNEDDVQPEGVGSTALCMLLMKMMLIQRDIISTLGFKVDALEKIIKESTDKK